MVVIVKVEPISRPRFSDQHEGLAAKQFAMRKSAWDVDRSRSFLVVDGLIRTAFGQKMGVEGPIEPSRLSFSGGTIVRNSSIGGH